MWMILQVNPLVVSKDSNLYTTAFVFLENFLNISWNARQLASNLPYKSFKKPK